MSMRSPCVFIERNSFFNTDSLRNIKRASEYKKVFDKQAFCLVADTRIYNDKIKMINEIAKSKEKIVFV